MTLNKHWKYPVDSDLVLAALRGLIASNPTLKLIPAEKVVFKSNDGQKKVAVISGGGAGHEPLHSGYVGSNLLDAAVSGAIFASPSTKQIMAAVKATADKDVGAVIVVKNYTGDVLHFGLVAERAKRDGYKIELVFVSDDVAVGRTQNRMVGRRGLAGTALVHKMIGAAASTGANVEKVAQFGREVNDSLITMSASLDRTSVPGREGESEHNDNPNIAELGLGIHNEPGQKIKVLEIEKVIDLVFSKLLDSNDEERHYVDFHDEDDYVLLVNNIGGTSSLELFAIAHYVVERCPLKRRPSRVLVSDFVTSLNSPGFSVTLLNLDKCSQGEFSKSEALAFLDMETDAPGWKPKTFPVSAWRENSREVHDFMHSNEIPKSKLKIDGQKFRERLTTAMNNVIEQEPKITKYDTLVGDGDCGETLKAGALAILNLFDNDRTFIENLDDPVATLSVITELVEDKMGGTSGGIYAIYLTSLVKNLQSLKSVDVPSIAQAMRNALYEGLFKYTKARKGGRTLVDTLQPFVDTLTETSDIEKSAKAASESCKATAQLEAKFGRASYVDEADLKEDGGIPDPGAVGLLAIIEGFVSKV